MPDLIEELERRSIYAAYTPDVPVSVEPGLIGLTDRLWQVGWRHYPGSSRPASQWQLIYLVGRVEEIAIIVQIPGKRIQRVGSGIVSKTEVCPAHGERRAIFPYSGR